MNLQQVKDKINKELLPLFGTGSRETRKWLMSEGFKYCPLCKQIKPVADFYPNPNKKSGSNYRTYCKPCGLAQSVKWNRENYKSKRGEYKKKIIEDFIYDLDPQTIYSQDDLLLELSLRKQNENR